MKIGLYFIIITTSLILFHHENKIIAQEAYAVRFGERPPIDTERVPIDAYEQGRILVKLSSEFNELIPQKGLIAENDEYIQTGSPALDAICRAYRVKSFSPYFGALYITNSKSLNYIERHKAWGFHLWFELVLNSRADIIEAVNEFALVEEIAHAEPVYKVQLVLNDPELNSRKPILPDETGGSRWVSNDPQYPNQWHFNNTGQQGGTPGADINLQNAWDFETGNSDVIVAIIDGGIDFTHNDLAANMWDGIGFNFVNNNSTIIPHNHGTHVAGTVAATTNNTIGVAGVAGGSGADDGVRLMSCQVFTSSSSGGFHIAPVYAADNGAAISQNSWGYIYPDLYSQAVLDAIDYFNIHGGGNALNGGITFFAAGNSNASGQWYPACYPGAFSIAATNNQDKKAWYSNFDTWIDISAPGGETNTMMSRGVLSTLINNSYGYYQGTSMACPHASGTAALIASLGYGELTAQQLADLLRNTTDNHYPVNPSFAGKLGTGRLNAHNALVDVFSLLSGVANPYNFNAVPESNTQIILSWQKNLDDHDVLLVFSNDSIFWEPVDGEVYALGQMMDDSVQVIYMGDGNDFEHENLVPATTYYYRIFSVNPDNEYSTGRPAIASTFCSHANVLPFIENFNASTSLPVCWEIADHIGNGQVWKFGRGAYLIGSTTNYAYLNSDAYGSGNSQNADLITMALDLSSYSGVTLSFRHYFRAFSSSMARLYYSIDNGENWTLLQTWNSSTSNPSFYSEPVPELDGQPNVRLKWKYTATFGYYWSLDDVEITGVSSDLILGNVVIPSNIDTCMFATQSIIVAGDGTTFSIENGGNIELVAGQSISFLDGTHVHEGASLLGRISTDGEFCVNPETMLNNEKDREINPISMGFTRSQESLFKIYPNPSKGHFNIALSVFNNKDRNFVMVFNLLGDELYSIEISEPIHLLDISVMPAGVYVVKVISGQKTGFRKVLKH